MKFFLLNQTIFAKCFIPPPPPALSMSRCNKEFREVPFFVKLHKELNNPTNMHNFGSVDR